MPDDDHDLLVRIDERVNNLQKDVSEARKKASEAKATAGKALTAAKNGGKDKNILLERSIYAAVVGLLLKTASDISGVEIGTVSEAPTSFVQTIISFIGSIYA